MGYNTCWRELITKTMEKNGDKWENVVFCTLDNEGLNTRFYDGFGGMGGEPFTLWTEEWVYFPICYDGAEWCGCAPRNPQNMPLAHQGGG